MMRNPPHDMTSVGPQCRHRISLQPTQDFSPQNLGFLFSHSRWPPLPQISYTMPDGLPPTSERLENVNFRQFLLRARKSGLRPHIWRLTKSVRAWRAYLSLSVLKITMSWNNRLASVNQRSLHCLEVTRRFFCCWSQKCPRNDQESLSTWSLV